MEYKRVHLDDEENIHRTDVKGWGEKLESLVESGKVSREAAALAVRNGTVYHLHDSSGERKNKTNTSGSDSSHTNTSNNKRQLSSSEAKQDEYENLDFWEINFGKRVGNLKNLLRTGWVLRLVKNPETVAEHSFRVAALTLLFSDCKEINHEKACVMALFHDYAETLAGDILPVGGVSSEMKNKIEKEAMQKLLSEIGNETVSSKLSTVWNEYEERKSVEALLVKDLDRFEMCLQAFEYELQNEALDLSEFFASVQGKLRNERVVKWFNQLLEKRNNRVVKSF